jgi:hypothetical protein
MILSWAWTIDLKKNNAKTYAIDNLNSIQNYFDHSKETRN